MKIGIIVAMDKELRQLQALFNDGNVRVEKCGIGKVNAALGAQRMINEFHPDCIISSGCAGGNGDDINIQDVVVSAQLCYHDVYCGDNCDPGQVQGLPRLFKGDERLVELASTLKTDVHIVSGLICSGDQFITNRDELDVIEYENGDTGRWCGKSTGPYVLR